MITHAARSRQLWPYVVYAVLSVAFCAPLFAQPNGLGMNDWDVILFYNGSALKSVFEYAQLPFWNPWYCGGNVLWQNPQVPLLSPAYPLAAIMSLPLAMKITIALHYWIGLAGMHLLLTAGLGLSFLPAVIYLSMVAVFGGAMAMHVGVGHSVFLPCFYIPLQLYFCVKAMRTGAVRDIALAAIMLALMVFNGAVQVMPMSIAALGALGLIASLWQRRLRPVLVTAVSIGGGLLLSAPKLLPVVRWISSDKYYDARNVLEHPDRMSVEMILHSLLDRFQHRGLHFDLQRSPWHEYGNYIGALAAILIAGSIVWILAARPRRDRWLGASLALTTLLLWALSAGEFSAWAPASLATHLPLFSNFRIPSRYTIAAVMFGAATAAWTLRSIDVNALPAGARTFLTVVCLLGGLDLFVTNRPQFERVFSIAPMDHGFAFGHGPRALETDSTSSAYTPDSPMFRSLMNSRSFYQCYEPLQTKRVAGPQGALVDSDGKSHVTDIAFSPNRIDFSVVNGREPSVLTLNQNFAYGWSSSAGAVVADRETGRPSVVLQPGEAGHFIFSFRPPGLATGLALMLGAMTVGFLFWKRRLPDW